MTIGNYLNHLSLYFQLLQESKGYLCGGRIWWLGEVFKRQRNFVSSLYVVSFLPVRFCRSLLGTVSSAVRRTVFRPFLLVGTSREVSTDGLPFALGEDGTNEPGSGGRLVGRSVSQSDSSVGQSVRSPKSPMLRPWGETATRYGSLHLGLADTFFFLQMTLQMIG